MEHTVLIADDSHELTCATTRALTADGYRTLTACAVNALAITLASTKPDLLLLGDFDAPGAGARIVRCLREASEPFSGAAPQTSVVMLSSDLSKSSCCARSKAPRSPAASMTESTPQNPHSLGYCASGLRARSGVEVRKQRRESGYEIPESSKGRLVRMVSAGVLDSPGAGAEPCRE